MNRCIALSLVCLAFLTGVVSYTQPLFAQAGLRDTLIKMDKNEDGEISPDELTPLARPYLERITRARRMSLDRPNDIDRILDAARVYYALRNGVSGKDIQPGGKRTVVPFGPKPDEPLVPEFGLPAVKYRYVKADVDEADSTMRRYDANRDGFIDVVEASKNRWTHRDPFEMDLNKDGRLSRMELAQRYARRRMLDGSSEEVWQRARRTGGLLPQDRRVRGVSNEEREGRRRREFNQWWSRGGSRNWLTASVLSRFDANRNGRLEASEAESLGVPTAQIDIDRDGELSRDELHSFIAEKQDEAGDLSEGLPGWFYELDADRDGQVAMPEFATEWTNDKLQEFTSLDTNRDGVLTASEVAQSKAMVGGSFSNRNAEVLPPRKTIISEIEVSEDIVIGDLNVQLSITHSNTSFLDAALTGPDGQRVELFSGVGGSGDHFDQTVFDDQSRSPITKARPPFKGAFMPHALIKRQPSLNHFNGKNAKGVWQLVVRGTRSERFGMLHHWSLMFKPKESMIGNTASASVQDGPRQTGSKQTGSKQTGSKQTGSKQTGPQQDAGRSSWPAYASPNDRGADTIRRTAKSRKSDSTRRGSEGSRSAREERSDSSEKPRKKQRSKEDIEKYKRWLEEKKRSRGKERKR